MTLVRSHSGGCPVCGRAHHSCGTPTTMKGVDEGMENVVTGGPLKLYNVTIGANTTRMRLNDTDAAFYREHHTAELVEAEDAQPVTEDGAGRTAGPKVRTPPNKLGGAETK